MSALGHYLEEEGIATVAISLIRPQTENTKADSTDRRKHDLCWPIGRHRRPTPRRLTVTLDEFISIAG